MFLSMRRSVVPWLRVCSLAFYYCMMRPQEGGCVCIVCAAMEAEGEVGYLFWDSQKI